MTNSLELRVMVLAPGRDAELTCEVLSRAGIECTTLESERELGPELAQGVGALLVAEEALTPGVERTIRQFVDQQPPWSDLPILVVACQDEYDVRLAQLMTMRSVSVLSRPMAVGTIITSIHSALAARSRQYEVRELLHERDEAARRKDEFLAMLAHELRNPLGPIRFGAQALRYQLNGHGHEITESVEMIERQVAHMSRLIDDLLDVSRLTRGRVSLRLKTVDMADLASQVVEARELLARKRQVSLKLEAPSAPLWVSGDADRLTQVLDNLVDNALKFCNPGGKVTVEVEPREGRVAVAVKDDGQGIDPAMLDRLFDPFTQADLSLDRSKGGLGLGLSIVKSLVALHGGEICVSSEGLGKGARFSFALPLVTDAGKPAPAAPKSAPITNNGPLKVVVIEDNPDGAAMLRMLLKLQGHQAEVAHSGSEGIELVGQYRPDVVLCDIGLPGMNGYEVAKALTGQDYRPPRMIAITGYGGAEDRDAALEAGFDTHLVKPVSHEALLSELNKVARSSECPE
jgi:two-component system, sensor histidine kinase